MTKQDVIYNVGDKVVILEANRIFGACVPNGHIADVVKIDTDGTPILDLRDDCGTLCMFPDELEHIAPYKEGTE